MKRIIYTCISFAVFIFTLILFCTTRSNAQLPVSFGEDYSIIRLFKDDGFSTLDISNARFALDEASVSTQVSDGRLWCDAYSYFTTASVATEGKNPIDCHIIVTGGDFFSFHSFDFLNGWYYTPYDQHFDRVVIDRRLAFHLFGSASAEDMTLEISGKELYVAGVVEYDDSQAKTLALKDTPIMYMPSEIAEELFGKKGFEYYEVMMQNHVDGYAYNTMSTVIEGATVVDVTDRFSLGSIFSLIKSFPTRVFDITEFSLPYWENADRGTEDILAVLLVVNFVTFVVFLANLIILILSIIKTRRKRL